jgi:hypothetical protein
LSGVNLSADLRSRGRFSNYINSSLMVSIHNNGSGAGEQAGKACGTETWYDKTNKSRSKSRRLASLIQKRLIKSIRENYDKNWCDRGIKGSDGNYAENRLSRQPAVLVELAFMDNKGNSDALKDEKFQQIATNAIAEAVKEFTNTTVYEFESMVGDNVTTTDISASNSFTGVCENCGLVGKTYKVFDAKSDKDLLARISLKNNKKPEKAEENPQLFDVEVINYTENKEVGKNTLTFDNNQYLASSSNEKNDYNDIYFKVNPKNADSLIIKVIAKPNVNLSFDKLELVDSEIALQKI